MLLILRLVFKLGNITIIVDIEITEEITNAIYRGWCFFVSFILVLRCHRNSRYPIAKSRSKMAQAYVILGR